MLASMAGFVVNLAIVPFITYFILAEGDTAIKKLIERVPNKYFEMTLNVLNKISNRSRGLFAWLDYGFSHYWDSQRHWVLHHWC